MAKHVGFVVLLMAIACQSLSATTYYGHESGTNLFGNPEFDSDMPGSSSNSWYKLGSNSMDAGTTSDGCFSGAKCAYALNRTASWVGLHSRVPATSLQPDTDYWVSLFIKITEDQRSPPGAPFSTPIILKTVPLVGTPNYDGLVPFQNQIADNTWRYNAGDFSTPNATTLAAWNYIEIYVDAPTSVGYMLDATSLQVISDPNWRDEAQQNIETYRKSDINLRVVVPSSMNPQLVTVKFKQVKNGFPFGSMVKADRLNDWVASGTPDQQTLDDNQKYRDWFNNTFDWAVFNHRSKWRQMEVSAKIEDDSKFTQVDNALDWLEAAGKTTRGHAIHWNKEEFNPSWVTSITDEDDFLTELNRRVDYMTEHYTGRFAHYDVSNEHANSHYFEDKTDNRDILRDLHARTRSNDENALLFTNNFFAIEASTLTAKTLNNAKYLQDNGGLIDAIGLQCHFSFSDYNGDPLTDFEKVKRRLHVFKSLGLPIWITEMNSDMSDLNDEADFFEDMLLLLYGTPEIEGIIFWGIEQFIDANYTSNAVGEVVERLIKTDWRTSFDVVPTSADFSASYRGFHGSYEITTQYDGVEVSKRPFELVNNKDLDVIYVDP